MHYVTVEADRHKYYANSKQLGASAQGYLCGRLEAVCPGGRSHVLPDGTQGADLEPGWALTAQGSMKATPA